MLGAHFDIVMNITFLFLATMRRMSEDERPLAMCLAWTDEGLENLDYYKFVLQENDSGEIMVCASCS